MAESPSSAPTAFDELAGEESRQLCLLLLSRSNPLCVLDRIATRIESGAGIPRQEMKSKPLQQVREAPHCLEARLVYADWLTEQGSPFGELIIAQCALATESDPNRHRKLKARSNALLKELAKAWGSAWKFKSGRLEYTQIVGSYDDKESLRCTFQGGVVDHVESHLLVFAAMASWLAENAPLMTSLALKRYRLSPTSEELVAAIECLPKLSAFALAIPHAHILDLPSDAPSPLVHAIATHSLFSELHSLSLEGSLSQDEVLSIAKSEVLQTLDSLDLYEGGLEAGHIAQLTQAQFQLDKLLLNQNNLGPSGVELLVNSEFVSELKELALYSNGLLEEGVESLAKSTHLNKLTTLDLRSNRIGFRGAVALGSSENLASLQNLVLVGNKLTADSIKALCSGLPALCDLNLQHTRLTDDAITALTQSESFCSHLQVLNLRSNKLTDDGAKQLADCNALVGLEQLNLNNNKGVGRAGIKALRSSETLKDTIIYAGNKRLTRL